MLLFLAKHESPIDEIMSSLSLTTRKKKTVSDCDDIFAQPTSDEVDTHRYHLQHVVQG